MVFSSSGSFVKGVRGLSVSTSLSLVSYSIDVDVEGSGGGSLLHVELEALFGHFNSLLLLFSVLFLDFSHSKSEVTSGLFFLVLVLEIHQEVDGANLLSHDLSVPLGLLFCRFGSTSSVSYHPGVHDEVHLSLELEGVGQQHLVHLQLTINGGLLLLSCRQE